MGGKWYILKFKNGKWNISNSLRIQIFIFLEFRDKMKFMQILGIKIIFQSSQYQSQNRFYWNWGHPIQFHKFSFSMTKIFAHVHICFFIYLFILNRSKLVDGLFCLSEDSRNEIRWDGVKLWFRFGRQLSYLRYFVGSQSVRSEKSLPILAYVVQVLVYCLIRVALCFYSSSMQW